MRQRFEARPPGQGSGRVARDLPPLPTASEVRSAIESVSKCRNGGVAWTLYRTLRQAGVQVAPPDLAVLAAAFLQVDKEVNGAQAANRVLELLQVAREQHPSPGVALLKVASKAHASLGEPDAVLQLASEASELLSGLTSQERRRASQVLSENSMAYMACQLVEAHGVSGRLDRAFAIYMHLCAGADALQASAAAEGGAAGSAAAGAAGGGDAHWRHDLADEGVLRAGAAGSASEGDGSKGGEQQRRGQQPTYRRGSAADALWAVAERAGATRGGAEVDACWRSDPPSGWEKSERRLASSLAAACTTAGKPEVGLEAVHARPEPPTQQMLSPLLAGFAAEGSMARVLEVLDLAQTLDLQLRNPAVRALSLAGGPFLPLAAEQLAAARATGARVSLASELKLLQACLSEERVELAEEVLDKQEGGLGGAIDVMGKLVRMSAHQERQRAVHRSMQRPTAEHEKVLAQIPRDARDRIKNESSSLSASRRPP